MGKFRRAIASIAMVAILSTLVVSVGAFAATYEDVPVDHWSYSYVEQLVADGVLDTSHDNFRPSDPVNRAEFGKMIVEKFGFEGDGLCSTDFADCTAGAWYDTYLGVAVAHNILRGDSDTGLMRPGDHINRAEAITVIHRAAGEVQTAFKGSSVYSDVGAGSWYDVSTGWAYCYGVAEGYADGHFGAANELLRSEAAKIIVEGEEPGDLRAVCLDVDDDDDVVVPTGDLTVSLASDTPASASLPQGATGVAFTKFALRAHGGDARVDEFTVKRVDMGDPADFASIYLYEGGKRLTGGRTVSSSTHEATFVNLGFTIPSGSTRYLTVVADINDGIDSGGLHAFQLTSGAGVKTSGGGTVGGSFPVRGNSMAISTVSVGEVTIDGLTVADNPSVGDTSAELARFELIVSSTEDIGVNRVSLYQGGNLSPSNIGNAVLMQGGDEVAAGAWQGNLLVFEFTESFEMERGTARIFNVEADILGGRPGDTVELYLDYDSDLHAVGRQYGYGVKVVNQFDTGDLLTLEGGQVTLSFVGPTTGDVTSGSRNVTLLEFNMTSAVNAEVRRTDVNIAVGAVEVGAGEVTDVRLVCDGATVAGPLDMPATIVGNTAAMQLTDNWYLAAGKTYNCKVMVDLFRDVSEGVELTATLGDFSGQIRDLESNQNITDIVPAAGLVGNTQTVTDAGLEVSLAGSPATGKVVKGSTVDAAGFVLTAEDASDVKVTSLRLTGYVDDDYSSTFTKGAQDGLLVRDLVTQVQLFDSHGNAVSSARSFDTAGNATFSGLNFTVTKGTSRTIIARATVSNSAPFGTTDNAFAIALPVGNMTAQDANGSSMNVTGGYVNEGPDHDVYKYIEDEGAGTLTGALSAENPSATVVLAGTTPEVLRARFSATDEAFKITKLRVARMGGALADYTSIQLVVGGDTYTKSMVGDNADFTGLDIMVPKDGNVAVSVRAELNTIANGATSGNDVRLQIMETGFEAFGQSSGERITSITDPIQGQMHLLRKTKPTFTMVGPEEGTLVAGVGRTVMELKIAAAAQEDVTFAEGASALAFRIVAGDPLAASDFDCTLIEKVSGDLLATAPLVTMEEGNDIVFEFDEGDFVVPAGGERTVLVKCNLTDYTGENDVFQVGLLPGAASKDDVLTNNVLWNDGEEDANEWLLIRQAIYGTVWSK